jgi:hypothetical protein
MSATTNNDQESTLETVVRAYLLNKLVTETEVVTSVHTLQPVVAPDLDEESIAEVVARLLTQLSVSVDDGISITSEEFKHWLAAAHSSVTWRRWRDYKTFLSTVSKLPPKVIEALDDATDKMLDYAGDPRIPEPWSRRGLVIGDVQSGKTANYLGLLNKATDAGYTLIIVLAGNTESLRRQTQERLEEGVIGKSSTLTQAVSKGAILQSTHVGVGKIDQSFVRAQGMTTMMSDFRAASNQLTNFSIDAMTSTPHVFVLKKNKAVLTAVKNWLASQPNVDGKLDVPMLLLDDESDYASVNTRGADDPTAINEAIRGILAVTRRSSYVAFTATPFANIFIDHDVSNDLFPKDYIVALEAPSNYFGARRTFLDAEAKTTYRTIKDAQPYFPLGHKSHHAVTELPESLKDALRSFLLVNSIRDLRRHDQKRSMLINVSRFKRVQALVGELVEEELLRLKNAIEHHALRYAQGVPNGTMDSMRATFDSRYDGSGVSWEEVLHALPAAVRAVKVRVFNSDTYKTDGVVTDSDRIIAIGGDVLSRGLTLDGLTVSYFYRRVGASDTLFQMARWFGYRTGYDDLCRLWIEPDAAADFAFVYEQIEELRDDLRRMEELKLTPVRFGLAVKKHPGTLLVTARNKMRAAESRPRTVSLAGRNIESTKLSPCPHVALANLRAVRDLVHEIETEVGPFAARAGGGGWQRAVDVPKTLISRFFANFRAADAAVLFDENVLSEFTLSARDQKMQSWQLVFAQGMGPSLSVSSALSILQPVRSVDGMGDPIRISAENSRLAGSTDLAALVPAERRAAIEAAHKSKSGGKTGPAEKAFYPALDTPALIVYLLDPNDKKVEFLDREAVHSNTLSPRQCVTHRGSRACPACIGCSDCAPINPADQLVDITFSSVDALVAIKVAIPGDPLDLGTTGDATYVINTVAQRRWLVEAPPLDSDSPTEDEVDLDE